MADVDRFVEDFAREHGLKLIFDDGAREVLAAQAIEKDQAIRTLCQQKVPRLPARPENHRSQHRPRNLYHYPRRRRKPGRRIVEMGGGKF